MASPDEWHSDLAQATQEVAGQHLLTTAPKQKNPWISEQTLTKIAERGVLSSAGRYAEAALVDKVIRKMAKQDRAKWFSDKLTSNVWDPVRILGKERGSKAVRLRGRTPEARPDQVFAEYLETHQ
eukprot:13840731-Alexandrium_andersonii.AAC.1